MIFRHTDTYKQDNYLFASQSKIIASDPEGYLF